MPIGETNPFRMLGAFAPSSQRLADAMTRYVKDHQGDRILEVGAGSGAITKALIKKMNHSQTSDVVEIFPQLASLLKMRFGDHKAVNIFGGDILDFVALPNSYDLIVCSLPFNAFAPQTCEAILTRLVVLAKDGAILSFFEYRILQGLAKLVLPKKKREQFLKSHDLLEQFNRRFKFDEEVVYMNIPPAIVHYLRIDKRRSEK